MHMRIQKEERLLLPEASNSPTVCRPEGSHWQTGFERLKKAHSHHPWHAPYRVEVEVEDVVSLS